VDINNLGISYISSARGIFDEITGIDSADLTVDEVDRYLPQVFIECAKSSEETLFYKVHDAYTYLPDNSPLIPTEPTRGAVYIIRNPLDTAISFSHHSTMSIDAAIETMASDDGCLARNKFAQQSQLRQKLLSWSNHVRSWTERPDFPRIVIRY